MQQIEWLRGCESDFRSFTSLLEGIPKGVGSGIGENRRVCEDFEEIVESSTMNLLDEPQGFGTMAYECSTTSRVKRDGKRRDPTVGSN